MRIAQTWRRGATGALLLLALMPAAAVGAGSHPKGPPMTLPQGPPGGPPSCAQGPKRIGDTIIGTPCADVIHAPPGVAAVDGEAGNDTIIPAAITATSSCPEECRLGIGSQTFEGGPGNDLVFGERGNDTLNGGSGNDRLYGGIGDDVLRGGPGSDLLSGGHGFDSVNGEAGNDYVRGDGTIDKVSDTGGGTDTLSYSTGITPGFGGALSPSVSGFPGSEEGRGVRLDLSSAGQNGNNGVAPFGGGVDEVEPRVFEKIIGTPFSDYIVGSSAGETIFGGGGADVIRGEGGNDNLYGGADGDDLLGGGGKNVIDGGAGQDHCEKGNRATSCEAVPAGVVPRDPGKIEVGLEAQQETSRTQLYLAGSASADLVTASYAAGPPASVRFELGAGSVGRFDGSAAAAGGCSAPTETSVKCSLPGPLDSIVLAGLGGNDEMKVVGFPSTVSVMLLGGEGSDRLSGGEQTEDVLVDGPGAGSDSLEALDRDDALMHNGGADIRAGGNGNDLFLSNSICDGDRLIGGEGRDNASWSKYTAPVEANLAAGTAGGLGNGEAPACGAEAPDVLEQIEDLEGSAQGDAFYGDAGPNQLLGAKGADSYFAQAGDDNILANSGDSDQVIDCGEGSDTAFIDLPTSEYHDPVPSGCETVREADVNVFTVLPGG